MDDWRIEGVAFCAGIEDAVSGVGEEVVEGVGGNKLIDDLKIDIYNLGNKIFNIIELGYHSWSYMMKFVNYLINMKLN